MIVNIEDFLKNLEEKQGSENKLSGKSKEDRDDYLTFMHCCLMGVSDTYVNDHISYEAYENILHDIMENITNRFGEVVAEKFAKVLYIRRIASFLDYLKKTEADTKPPTGGLN